MINKIKGLRKYTDCSMPSNEAERINKAEVSAYNQAIEDVVKLFAIPDVVGRSESFVCGHPPKRTYLVDGTWHCEECGGKWESIANK